MGNDGFIFVAQGPTSMGFSQATRTKIRRQAMKAVGAKRRKLVRPASGYENRRQSPPDHRNTVLVESRPLTPSVRRVPDVGDIAWTAEEIICDPTTLGIPRPLPASGMQLIIHHSGFSPMDLATLDTGAPNLASSILANKSYDLATLLSYPTWSFLTIIPSRVGNLSCMDDAVQALLGKARLVLGHAPPEVERVVLCTYGKALKGLQDAVNQGSEWIDISLICAAQILALFELLNSPESANWQRHLVGAKRLVQARGPYRFQEELESTILLSMCGPFLCEAILRNEECFLDQPAWRLTLKQAMSQKDSVTDRSPIALELNLAMAKMPGLIKRVTHLVCHEDSPSDAAIDAIVDKMSDFRRLIQRWRARFGYAILVGNKDESLKDIRSRRFEMQSTALILLQTTARCLAAVDMSQAAMLEEEAQAAARETIEMQRTIAGDNARAVFYLAQKAKVAKSIFDTASFYPGPIPTDGGRLIERWRFERWCAAIPRLTTKIGCCA